MAQPLGPLSAQNNDWYSEIPLLLYSAQSTLGTRDYRFLD